MEIFQAAKPYIISHKGYIIFTSQEAFSVGSAFLQSANQLWARCKTQKPTDPSPDCKRHGSYTMSLHRCIPCYTWHSSLPCTHKMMVTQTAGQGSIPTGALRFLVCRMVAPAAMVSVQGQGSKDGTQAGTTRRSFPTGSPGHIPNAGRCGHRPLRDCRGICRTRREARIPLSEGDVSRTG